MTGLYIILLWLIIVFSISLIVKLIYPKEKEIIRKVIHIGSAPLIPIGIYFEIPKINALSVAIIVSLIVLLNYNYKFIPFIEDVNRKSLGTTFYCISFTILIGLFWNNNQYCAYAGSFIMAFADGFAGIIGIKFKSYKWKILGNEKSLFGTITMFTISLFILQYLNSLYIINLSDYKLIFIAIIATVIEQISELGIDNLTVPLITALLVRFL